MQLLIGSVLTVALVLTLTAAIWPAALGRIHDLRGAAYMLLIGVPALVVQSDLIAIASLAGGAMAVFELLLLTVAI